MWIRLECESRLIKLRVSSVQDQVKDLDDFAFILTKKINDLEKVHPQKLKFLDNNYNTLLLGASIKSLAETFTDLISLVVRYSISDTNSKWDLFVFSHFKVSTY